MLDTTGTQVTIDESGTVSLEHSNLLDGLDLDNVDTRN